MSDEGKEQEPTGESSAGETSAEEATGGHVRPFKVLVLFGLAAALLYYFVGNLPHDLVPSAVAWQTEPAKAFRQAASSDKVVFADFYADWCGPCREMDHEVFGDKQFAARLERLAVPLRFDLTQKAGQQVALKYGVYQIPTYVVMTSGGEVLARYSGFISGERLLKMVQKAADHGAAREQPAVPGVE